jgi:hypothetical protein
MSLGTVQIFRVESFGYEFGVFLLAVTTLSEVPTMKQWGRDLDMQLTDLRFGQDRPGTQGKVTLNNLKPQVNFLSTLVGQRHYSE